MHSSEILDKLVVGTGHAGIAAGEALRRRDMPFEVVDVGYDLEDGIECDVRKLAAKDPSEWEDALKYRLYQPPVVSIRGVERRNSFGSEFTYRVPDCLSVSMGKCTSELSHAFGGFGNVWGAAMLPYSDHGLRDWPIPNEDLKTSYANVLRYVPLSAVPDDLRNHFPLFIDHSIPLQTSPQSAALLAALEKNRQGLSLNGLEFGRSRLAVDASQSSTGCRYCGRCLEGCPYGSIFNPRLLWKQHAETGVAIHRGYYVVEFEEQPDHVDVTTVSVTDGSLRKWKTRRLYLAAGHIATARLVARSLKRFNDSIRIADGQYFFFPLISYRSHRAEMQFTLADVFLEMLNREVSENYVHFQIYGANQFFEQALRTIVPAPFPVSPVLHRLYLVQGFLHSDECGHLELTVTPGSEKSDEIILRGVENPNALRTARKAQALLRKVMLGFGIIPPAYLKLAPVGRSFHGGASFPMGGSHPFYSSDTLGRPAGLKRVHIIDSANFPTIPGSTIALSIMANADRIAAASSEIDPC